MGGIVAGRRAALMIEKISRVRYDSSLQMVSFVDLPSPALQSAWPRCVISAEWSQDGRVRAL
jgi:hypothetical protein